MEFTKKEFIDCDLLTGVETAFVNQPYPIRSVVSGKYKLIHYLYPSILLPQGGVETRSPEYQLFDLENDPGELNNQQPRSRRTVPVGDEKYAGPLEQMGSRGS